MNIRNRFALQASACAASAATCIATLVNPQWFEYLVDEAPDSGDGSLETWVAVAVSLVACLTFARMSWRTWSRWRATTSGKHTQVSP